MTDPRIEAATEAVQLYNSRGGWITSEGLATAALAAADKAATITTSTKLGSLPVGTIAIDGQGDLCKRLGSGWFGIIEETHGDPWLARGMEDITLPARVIHFGGTE